MSFKLRHLFGALILHGLLFGLLAGGAQCSRQPHRPPVIEAVLLDPSRAETQAERRREDQERRAAEQRRKEQQRREQERREEAERQEQARVAAEAEAQRKGEVEAQRKAAEAEVQRKAEEARKQKELAQKKKAEEDARKKKEEQARREKEQQAEARDSLEQAMREEQLQRQAQREQEARTAAEQDVAISNWTDLVRQKVARNWIRPPASQERDFECAVAVQMLPGGQVVNASIAESCGSPALDDSVIKAVLRSDPLPVIANAPREFTFRFVP